MMALVKGRLASERQSCQPGEALPKHPLRSPSTGTNHAPIFPQPDRFRHQPLSPSSRPAGASRAVEALERVARAASTCRASTAPFLGDLFRASARATEDMTRSPDSFTPRGADHPVPQLDGGDRPSGGRFAIRPRGRPATWTRTRRSCTGRPRSSSRSMSSTDRQRQHGGLQRHTIFTAITTRTRYRARLAREPPGEQHAAGPRSATSPGTGSADRGAHPQPRPAHVDPRVTAGTRTSSASSTIGHEPDTPCLYHVRTAGTDPDPLPPGRPQIAEAMSYDSFNQFFQHDVRHLRHRRRAQRGPPPPCQPALARNRSPRRTVSPTCRRCLATDRPTTTPAWHWTAVDGRSTRPPTLLTRGQPAGGVIGREGTTTLRWPPRRPGGRVEVEATGAARPSLVYDNSGNLVAFNNNRAEEASSALNATASIHLSLAVGAANAPRRGLPDRGRAAADVAPGRTVGRFRWVRRWPVSPAHQPPGQRPRFRSRCDPAFPDQTEVRVHALDLSWSPGRHPTRVRAVLTIFQPVAGHEYRAVVQPTHRVSVTFDLAVDRVRPDPRRAPGRHNSSRDRTLQVWARGDRLLLSTATRPASCRVARQPGGPRVPTPPCDLRPGERQSHPDTRSAWLPSGRGQHTYWVMVDGLAPNGDYLIRLTVRRVYARDANGPPRVRGQARPPCCRSPRAR
jgi:hypothetical protein